MPTWRGEKGDLFSESTRKVETQTLENMTRYYKGNEFNLIERTAEGNDRENALQLDKII